jgi:DNA modification methylase
MSDTVWEFARPKRSLEHPTMKPVELVEHAIQNSTNPHDVVLDAFGGSGTTVIACQEAGRAARAIELLPKYCDVIVRRWQEFTGQQARHEGSGRAFDDLAKTALDVDARGSSTANGTLSLNSVNVG